MRCVNTSWTRTPKLARHGEGGGAGRGGKQGILIPYPLHHHQQQQHTRPAPLGHGSYATFRNNDVVYMYLYTSDSTDGSWSSSTSGAVHAADGTVSPPYPDCDSLSSIRPKSLTLRSRSRVRGETRVSYVTNASTRTHEHGADLKEGGGGGLRVCRGGKLEGDCCCEEEVPKPAGWAACGGGGGWKRRCLPAHFASPHDRVSELNPNTIGTPSEHHRTNIAHHPQQHARNATTTPAPTTVAQGHRRGRKRTL